MSTACSKVGRELFKKQNFLYGSIVLILISIISNVP